MNQAQAVVTALIRILAGVPLLLLIGVICIPPTVEFNPQELATFTGDLDAGIRAMDFAGGTVVHVGWMSYAFLALLLLLVVFAKKVAVWITPETKQP